MDEHTIFDDIRELLRQRNTPDDLPLVPLFDSILTGTTTRAQYAQFGNERAKQGRSIIYQTLFGYALATENATLYWVLTRFRDYHVRRPGQIGKWQPIPDGLVVPNTVAFLGLEAFGLTMSL